MRISLIAAVSANGVIGRGEDLPWRLPDDLKHFKRLTMGHHVIMGRRTFDTVGRPLPGRTIVVISRQPQEDSEGILWASTLDEALARIAVRAAPDRPGGGSEQASTEVDDEVFVAGGGEIYRLALTLADRIYLTRVHAEVDGDVFFPELEPSAWLVIAEEHHPADDRHAHEFTFQTLEPAITG